MKSIKKHKLLLTTIVFLSMLVFSFQNCSDHDVSELEYYNASTEAFKVLDAKCVSCHSPGSTTASPIPDIKDFATLEAQEINGLPVLVMGEPQNSLMYQILIDKIAPHDSLDLTSSDLNTLAAWINEDEFIAPDTNIYFYQVDAILKFRCAGCHPNSGGFSVANYTSVMRQVTAGDPLASELFMRLMLPDGDPKKMPKDSAMTADEINTVFLWIQNGAQNK